MEERERDRERDKERERHSDYVPDVKRGGAGPKLQSHQTQRFTLLTKINIQTNGLLFDRIICSETFRIQDEFLHLFKYNFICVKRKRIIAI